MPTYEYQCTECGATFELFQQMSEKPKRRVPANLKSCDCDAPVTRLIGSGAGVLFRGNGFYETDYRSEGYKKAAKAEKEAGTTKKEDGKKAEPTKKPDTKDKGGKKPVQAA